MEQITLNPGTRNSDACQRYPHRSILFMLPRLCLGTTPRSHQSTRAKCVVVYCPLVGHTFGSRLPARRNRIDRDSVAPVSPRASPYSFATDFRITCNKRWPWRNIISVWIVSATRPRAGLNLRTRLVAPVKTKWNSFLKKERIKRAHKMPPLNVLH